MGHTVLERGLRSAARRILERQSVGHPASVILRVLGAEALGGQIDKLCRYVPRRFRVQIPAHIAPQASFLIDSDRGHDQCACSLWWKGWGGYEAVVTSLFAAYSRDANCIVDVGANSGLFSLTAAACSSGSIIHAFEPFPPCQVLLEKNLQLNSLESRVKIRHEALSEESGHLNLYVPLQDQAGYDETSCSLNAGFRDRHSQVLSVPVTTLDEYCANEKIDRIDLLKIDVETHEPQVLRGARRILDVHRPIIFLEVLDVADTSALNEIARQHNYIPVLLARDFLEICSDVAYRSGHCNQLFCPTEKLASFRQLAHRLRYPVRERGAVNTAA